MCRQHYHLKTDKGNFNVSCGKCYQCKAQRKQQWQFRLNIEQKHALSSTFLTLTYSDGHIPTTNNVQHLHKKDLQNFIKTIRNDHLRQYKEEHKLKTIKHAQLLAPQIRYFAAGEYGEKTNRPHYHVILFNYPRKSYDTLSELWGKGQVHIGDVNQHTIAYTAKYIMKSADTVQKENPMFNTMSRRPAIGHQYLQHKKWHIQNQTLLCKDQNGNLMLLPKFYRKKFFSEITLQRLLREHFVEYEQNLTKEEERLLKLGNNLGQLEYSQMQDELRKQRRTNKQETL
jgi:hypothetical protein